jgi:membrane-associated phospholipid phosphatase
MSESPRTARRVTRRWPLVSGILAVVVAAAAGALIGLRESNVEFDVAWMENLSEVRSPFWEVPARLMDFLGGGWFGVFAVPIGVAVLLILAKRRWAAVYFLIASILSAGIVQLLKNLYDRARPEQILVVTDHGSFPSGHVANAATLAVALGIILGRVWVWFAGAVYTVLMLLSRTYLGAHWLSDTLGGLLVGAGVAVIVWAPFASRLNRERAPRRSLATEN